MIYCSILVTWFEKNNEKKLVARLVITKFNQLILQHRCWQLHVDYIMTQIINKTHDKAI